MRARSLLTLALVLALGCGGPKYASVSGTVTLDGKPLPNATVSFQPIAPKGSANAEGPGSAGKTDAKGHFTLKRMEGQSGALVGNHRVMISQVVNDPESDGRPVRGGPPQVDLVPAKYNSKSELTFEVPSGGTDKADFTLTSN